MRGENRRQINRISLVFNFFQIHHLLKEKVKVGYFSLKNLFASYDPSDDGSVDRECLRRILSTFLGMPLSYSQFHRLMKRQAIFIIYQSGVLVFRFFSFFQFPITSNQFPDIFLTSGFCPQ